MTTPIKRSGSAVPALFDDLDGTRPSSRTIGQTTWAVDRYPRSGRAGLVADRGRITDMYSAIEANSELAQVGNVVSIEQNDDAGSPGMGVGHDR